MTVHNSWTLDRLVEEYTQHERRTRGLRPQTLHIRARLVRMFVRGALGTDPIDPTSFAPADGGVLDLAVRPVLSSVDAVCAVVVAVVLPIPALQGILQRRARGCPPGRR